jgi:putative ABC transport system permease protein
VTAWRLVRANLARNRLRTALTASAVALATLLVCLLLTMPAGLDAFLERAASNTRISVVNEAGLVYSLPYSLVRRIRGLPGVADALGVVWFGGSYEEEGRVTFPSFAVEAEHVAGTYPDYGFSPEVLSDFERYRDGALVGPATLERYGWKPGDRVTLRSNVWNVDLDLRIVGEIPRTRSPVVWVHREYLDQALQARLGSGLGSVGLVWVRAERPGDVQPVMQAIDQLTRRGENPTTAQTEKSFFSSFLGSLQGFLSVLLAVTALVALCIVFIAANTASLSIRERSGEIALLKALGFGRRRLFALLLAETLLLATSSGVLGVGLASALTGLLRATAGRVPQLGPLGGFAMTGEVVTQGLVLALAVGLLAGVVPAWGAARRPVAETLRGVF